MDNTFLLTHQPLLLNWKRRRTGNGKAEVALKKITHIEKETSDATKYTAEKEYKKQITIFV